MLSVAIFPQKVAVGVRPRKIVDPAPPTSARSPSLSHVKRLKIDDRLQADCATLDQGSSGKAVTTTRYDLEQHACIEAILLIFSLSALI